jgi:ArsR family transcriptional regulator
MNLEKIFKVLGDGNRLRILNLLMRGELCVCEIEGILGLSQTNVSRHLGRLSAAGIIDSRKNAQWVFYRINDDFGREHVSLAKYLEASFGADRACRRDSVKLKKNKKALVAGRIEQCRQV